MNTLNPDTLLACMRRHETLTIDDIAKAENLGFVPEARHLSVLLSLLTQNGDLIQLPDVEPETYTITSKGMGAANS